MLSTFVHQGGKKVKHCCLEQVVWKGLVMLLCGVTRRPPIGWFGARGSALWVDWESVQSVLKIYTINFSFFTQSLKKLWTIWLFKWALTHQADHWSPAMSEMLVRQLNLWPSGPSPLALVSPCQWLFGWLSMICCSAKWIIAGEEKWKRKVSPLSPSLWYPWFHPLAHSLLILHLDLFDSAICNFKLIMINNSRVKHLFESFPVFPYEWPIQTTSTWWYGEVHLLSYRRRTYQPL